MVVGLACPNEISGIYRSEVVGSLDLVISLAIVPLLLLLLRPTFRQCRSCCMFYVHYSLNLLARFPTSESRVTE